MVSKLEKILERYKKLRPSRKISLVLFIIFFLCGQVASILSAIGITNFSQLISHISIPSGYIYLDLDIYSPDTMTVQTPYEIYNPGLYELTHIEINVDLRVNYINVSNHANITSHVFSKTDTLGSCPALSKLDGIIDGEFSDFFIPPLVEFHNNSDEFEPVVYLLDIQFSAKYFLGLIDFQYKEYNLTI